MNKEGFDLDFEPTLENKYECPICLLILRDPMQTECGHRFCKFCIERWLSDEKKKCPIDNEDLTVGKMFPDNFAKREILSMKVRCPNRKMGCNTCVELKHVEEHTESCPYHYQPCPNNCQSLVLRKDLEEHLQSECSKRNFICSFCKETMLFELYGDHEIICPARMVPCDLCKEDVMREKIVEHVATTCPHATVKCCFFLLGCHKEIKREKMEKHMKSNVQKHLQLMCCAFVKLLNFQNIESILSSRTSGNTSTQNQTESMNDPIEISGELNALLQTAEGAASGVADGGPFRLPRVNLPSARPLSMTVPVIKPPVERLTSEGKSNLADGASSSELFDSEFQSLKERNTYQDESLARHSHELLELQYKFDNLERNNKELRQKIRSLEDKINSLSDIEGRLCNGLYIWKIKNYLQRRHEAEAGEMTVIHSPPFYSNFYGYKLCMRCNLNGVDFSVGTHLSVFIHFMQGEWDDILTWPFRGKIVLSVLDQNPVADQRQHAVETLVSKPMLAAFQRPTTHRNHKGFGYMEYVPLEVLDNSTYVVNDTLILKAQVFPEV